MDREQIEAQASADHERRYDPNNAPTFAWAEQKLAYMGGECEEVRFESGRTLVHLFNPQQPRTGGVCPARDNAAMLGQEIVRRWNAYESLLAACILMVEGHPLNGNSHCPDCKSSRAAEAAIAKARAGV
jgi:hypothetical protein